MKTYLIGTPALVRGTTNAYLLEIEILDNTPPFLLNYKSASEANNYFDNCVRGQVFKIVKLLMKASDGTGNLSFEERKELAEKHKEEKMYLKESSEYSKIYFKNTFSKYEEEQLKPGTICIMPENFSNLIFLNPDEKDAIDCFKKRCEYLYFGPLNDYIDFSIGYRNKQDPVVIGNITNGKKTDSISFKDLDYGCYAYNGKFWFQLDSDGGYDDLYDLRTRFYDKFKFLTNVLQRTPETLFKLYNIVKSKNSKFAGYCLKVHVKDTYNISPWPFFRWDDYFISLVDDVNQDKIVITDFEDFIINSQNFVSPAELFDRGMMSALPFISENIRIRELNGEIENIKDYIRRKNSK